MNSCTMQMQVIYPATNHYPLLVALVKKSDRVTPYDYIQHNISTHPI